jgi:hypothetical protein
MRAVQDEIAKDGVDIIAFRLMFCQVRSRATPLIGWIMCAAQPPTLLEVLDRIFPRIPGSRSYFYAQTKSNRRKCSRRQYRGV